MGGSTDGVECKPCTSECPPATFITGSCDGMGSTNEVRCTPCKICGIGEYQEKICTASADTVCSRCKTKCAKGTIIDDRTRCDGKAGWDTTKCVPDPLAAAPAPAPSGDS